MFQYGHLKQVPHMSRKTLTILIILVLVLQSRSFVLDVSSEPDDVSLVALYAHAPRGPQAGGQPILNALDQWGTQQQAARLQQGEAVFTLDPAFCKDVVLKGTATIRLWLVSDSRLSGSLAVFLAAGGPNGTRAVTPSFNDTVFLDTRSRNFNFLVTINELALPTGSTVELHVKLTSEDKRTGVSLLYDSQAAPTQITIPIVNPTDVTITLLDDRGTPSRVFEPQDGSDSTTVTVQVGILDALGLYRLIAASLSILDSSGGAVLTAPNILPSAVAVSVCNATYKTSLNVTLNAYKAQVSVTDSSGNTVKSEEDFYVAPYFDVNIRLMDSSHRPLTAARLLLNNSLVQYETMVGATGVGILHVPSSKIVGSYDLVVEWKNLIVSRSALFISEDTSLNVGVEAYDVTLRVRILGFDLPNAVVNLLAASGTVSSGLTNATGAANFTQIPPGVYDLEVSYLGTSYRSSLNVTRRAVTIIAVPLPYQDLLPYLVILVGALAAVAVVLRRRRIYRWPFEYMNMLTSASIPNSHTTVIAGNSGSGKSVVMESLAYQSLSNGRGCVYVTNVELPSDVRATTKSLGMDLSEFEDQGKLVFIDCYSSLSGSASREKRSTSSITDLTALGIQITQAMEEISGTVDVYLDALTPLFSVLKTEYVLNFLQSIGARVKSYDGGLCTAIGTTVEKDAATKVEEVADCVIETHLSEGRGGQRRRLRVKKLRGHPYVDSWARFTISDQGITFLTHRQQKS